MPPNPTLRRIQSDIRELARNPSPMYSAAPFDDDMFQWHFTLRGPPATSFSGGLYHGKIMLPPEYPFKPPNILFKTPNGRFQVNQVSERGKHKTSTRRAHDEHTRTHTRTHAHTHIRTHAILRHLTSLLH